MDWGLRTKIHHSGLQSPWSCFRDSPDGCLDLFPPPPNRTLLRTWSVRRFALLQRHCGPPRVRFRSSLPWPFAVEDVPFALHFRTADHLFDLAGKRCGGVPPHAWPRPTACFRGLQNGPCWWLRFFPAGCAGRSDRTSRQWAPISVSVPGRKKGVGRDIHDEIFALAVGVADFHPARAVVSSKPCP